MEIKKLPLAIIAGFAWTITVCGPAQAVCNISATSIAFGAYDVLSPMPHDTTGTIIYRCEGRDKDITISINAGGASSFGNRRMVNGNDQLFYNLYLDAGRTVVWGDGSGGTQFLFERNPKPNNRDILVPIFGRIPAQQNVKVGNYTDTITATLNF